MRYVLLVSLLSMVAACGGSQPAPDAPPPAAEPSATTEPAPAAPAEAPAAQAPPTDAGKSLAPAKPWADLSKDERVAHMKTVVVPHMKPLFQASPDADDFKDFSCGTCHGPSAKQGNFDMPNPALPKLDPKDGFKVHMDKDPGMTKFMMETVLPEMAKTLGMTPYDPKTNSGFSCGACHEIKK
jgi:hypothetical protein